MTLPIEKRLKEILGQWNRKHLGHKLYFSISGDSKVETTSYICKTCKESVVIEIRTNQ